MLFSHRPRTDEFEAAAMPHMADIYRTASRLLGAGTGADDVVQDVYLQAWKSFGQFELGTNCRAWLFKILFHTLHHYRRKWLNLRMINQSEEILDLAPAGSPPLPDHITDEEMLAALAEVPQDFRAVVLLIDVEEFSYKEAAGILNVPIGTVMSRLSRGRKLLRDRLAGSRASYGIGRSRKEKAHERMEFGQGGCENTRKYLDSYHQQRTTGGNQPRRCCAHLESCAGLHRRRPMRARLRTRLKAAVQSQSVPPELQVRVREHIRDHESRRWTGAGWHSQLAAMGGSTAAVARDRRRAMGELLHARECRSWPIVLGRKPTSEDLRESGRRPEGRPRGPYPLLDFPEVSERRAADGKDGEPTSGRRIQGTSAGGPRRRSGRLPRSSWRTSADMPDASTFTSPSKRTARLLSLVVAHKGRMAKRSAGFRSPATNLRSPASTSRRAGRYQVAGFDAGNFFAYIVSDLKSGPISRSRQPGARRSRVPHEDSRLTNSSKNSASSVGITGYGTYRSGPSRPACGSRTRATSPGHVDGVVLRPHLRRRGGGGRSALAARLFAPAASCDTASCSC